MKTFTTFLKQCLFILPAFLLFNCAGDKNKENADIPGENLAGKGPCVLTCAGETVLDLETHTLDVHNGRSERTLFHSDVSTRAGNIDTLADNIAYTEFCRMKGYANSITSSCPTESVITGIRVSLGLETDLIHMKLIYTPVKLCLTSTTTVTDTSGTYTIGNFSVVGSYATMYYYDEGHDVFTALTASVVTADTERYFREIKLRHLAGAAPGNYSVNPTNDTLSDVKSVIFAFQEIKALHDDNSPQPDHITVWNSFRDYSYGKTTLRKHSVFLGPDYLGVGQGKDLFIFSGGYKGAYANLAHLCPPNCSNLVFRLN